MFGFLRVVAWMMQQLAAQFVGLCCNFVKFRNLCKDPISTLAGFFYVLGFQGKSHPFRCCIGLVNRNVTPPDATVVPEMMVGIFIIDFHDDFSAFLHAP